MKRWQSILERSTWHLMKTYSELIQLPSFKERFEYLSLKGAVGEQTFGAERYLNQLFYRSREWRSVRDAIIIRDSCNGCPCDLGHPDRPILGSVVIHHMNPIRSNDIRSVSDILLNPEYLICVSFITHEAIHYGDFELLPKDYVPRTLNDTIPWK